MDSDRSRPLILVGLLVVAFFSSGPSCGSSTPVAILVDSPLAGGFVNASSVLVEGRVTGLTPAQADVQVNGTSVVVQADRSWSHTVPLDTVAVINPIVVELHQSNAPLIRKRVTVIAGDSIPDGAFSPQSVAMRLNDSGLDQVEPVITSLIPLDLATLLPPGTQVIDDFCYLSLFGLCIASTDAFVNPFGGSSKPLPSISSFSIDVDSQSGSVHGDVQLNGMFVSIRATGVNCDIDINATTANIDADYGLTGAVDGSVDVTQLTNPIVSFGGFSDSTNCSGLLGGLVEFFVDLLIGDVQTLVRDAFVDFLSVVDANGNTPIAAAIETALVDVEIAGPIGNAIGVNLEAPIFDVFEDAVGLTLDSDSRVTASMPDPTAVDLLASYHVSELFPSFGATTPVSGLPYDLGLCISTSAFNQLLKAEVESGLLISTLTDLDLGFGPIPITGSLLGTLVPELSVFGATELFEIRIAPTMAPLVTGNTGPGGEVAELVIPHLTISIVRTSDAYEVLRMAVDARVGLDVGFSAGQLSFNVGTLQSQDLRIDVLANPLLANEPQLVALLEVLVPPLFPSLAGSLGTFPLPEFLGLEPAFLEADRAGQFVSLFLDLQPVP